jgi:hypothetical protein
VDNAEQCTDRHLLSGLKPRLELLPAPGVRADLAPLSALAVADEDRPAVAVKIALGERLADTQTSAPEHHDQAA